MPRVATKSGPHSASLPTWLEELKPLLVARRRTDTKTAPASGKSMPAPSCALAKARPKSLSSPMTSPVDFISRPEDQVDTRKAGEGEYRFLDRDMAARAGPGAGDVVGEGFAGHHPRGDLGDRDAGRLGDKGNGARGARVDLEHIDIAVLDRKWCTTISPTTLSPRASATVWRSISATVSLASAKAVGQQQSRRCRRNGSRLPRCVP